MWDGKLPIAGCSPDFIPDEVLATREMHALPVEEQIANEKLRWPTDELNPDSPRAKAAAAAAEGDATAGETASSAPQGEAAPARPMSQSFDEDTHS